METDEKFLEVNFGKANPFKVPDGYFADFESRMICRINEEKAQSVRKSGKSIFMRELRPLLAAACILGIVFGLLAYFSKDSSLNNSTANNNANSYPAASSYSAVDAMADNAMMDNDDIYALVSNY